MGYFDTERDRLTLPLNEELEERLKDIPAEEFYDDIKGPIAVRNLRNLIKAEREKALATMIAEHPGTFVTVIMAGGSENHSFDEDLVTSDDLSMPIEPMEEPSAEPFAVPAAFGKSAV